MRVRDDEISQIAGMPLLCVPYAAPVVSITDSN
jgi:hypothetical protein